MMESLLLWVVGSFLILLGLGVVIQWLFIICLVYFLTGKTPLMVWREVVLDDLILPGEVVEALEEFQQALQPQGFEPLGMVKNKVEEYETLIALYLHPGKHILAKVILESGEQGLLKKIVEYTSQYQGGEHVFISNSRDQTILATFPGVSYIKFPCVQEPLKLLQVHQAYLEKYPGTGGLVSPVRESVSAYMVRECREVFLRQAKAGNYHYDGETDPFILTWKGAIYQGLRVCFPFKQLSLMAIGWQAHRLLRILKIKE